MPDDPDHSATETTGLMIQKLLPILLLRNQEKMVQGMAERDAAGCPSKSVAFPAARAWVLNSLAKFVHCVQMFAKLGFKVFILCADGAKD